MSSLETAERYLVIADIHGRANPLKMALARFTREKCDHILIAGDLLARHSFETSSLLMQHAGTISAVQGNGDRTEDAEGTGILLPMARTWEWHGRHLLMYHGHQRSSSSRPILPPGSILIYGHTHIPEAYYDEESSLYVLNPGSITLPRSSIGPTYGILTPDGISVHDLITGDRIMHRTLR